MESTSSSSSPRRRRHQDRGVNVHGTISQLPEYPASPADATPSAKPTKQYGDESEEPKLREPESLRERAIDNLITKLRSKEDVNLDAQALGSTIFDDVARYLNAADDDPSEKLERKVGFARRCFAVLADKLSLIHI